MPTSSFLSSRSVIRRGGNTCTRASCAARHTQESFTSFFGRLLRNTSRDTGLQVTHINSRPRIARFALLPGAHRFFLFRSQSALGDEFGCVVPPWRKL